MTAIPAASAPLISTPDTGVVSAFELAERLYLGYSPTKAASKITTSHLLEALAQYANPSIMAGIASNPASPPALLRVFIDDPRGNAGRHVAANRSTPPRWLAALASRRGNHQQLAKNPSLPADAVTILFEEKTSGVWELLAKNPATSPSMLDALADAGSEDVRKAVASNPRISSDTYQRLSKMPYEAIHRALARNPRTPLDQLLIYVSSSDPNMRSSVARNPSLDDSTFAKLARDSTAGVVQLLASNKSAPAHILSRLVGISESVEARVAANTASPAELLSRLSASGDMVTRRHVAMNPSTPEAAVIALVRDDAPAVVRAAARHQMIPTYYLSSLPLAYVVVSPHIVDLMRPVDGRFASIAQALASGWAGTVDSLFATVDAVA